MNKELPLKRCDVPACPHPLGHAGIHQVDWRLVPKCRCGHRKYDHPFGGSCNPGNRACGCPAFNEDNN